MQWLITVTSHGIWPVLETALHEFTPFAMLNALTFGNVSSTLALGTRILYGPHPSPQRSLHALVFVWIGVSASVLIWLGSVVVLNNIGHL
jgi:hypothetical protein